MKQEIINWYSERHYQPDKMLRAGAKRGFTPAQVEAAMVYCYNKIRAGKKVLDVDVARYVWNVIKGLDAGEYEKHNRSISEYRSQLKKQKEDFFASLMVIILVNLLIWLAYFTRGY